MNARAPSANSATIFMNANSHTLRQFKELWSVIHLPLRFSSALSNTADKMDVIAVYRMLTSGLCMFKVWQRLAAAQKR